MIERAAAIAVLLPDPMHTRGVPMHGMGPASNALVRHVVLPAVLAGVTVIVAGCCFPLPSSRSSATSTPTYKSTAPVTFSFQQPTHEWLVAVTYPAGLPEGAPYGKITVSTTTDTSDRYKYLHVSIVPQEPAGLGRSSLIVGSHIFNEDSSPTIGAMSLIDQPVCDGCTRQFFVRASLLQPLEDASSPAVSYTLEFEADQHRPQASGEPKPAIKVTPLDTADPSGDIQSSEAQLVDEVKPTIPVVRYVHARTTGPGAIRITSDTPEVDLTVLMTPTATASTTGTTARPRRPGTTASSSSRAELTAVSANSWLPVAEDCTDACDVGVFVVATPQHDYPANADAATRRLRFVVDVAESGSDAINAVEPTTAGDSAQLDLQKGTGSGAWSLTTPDEPALSLALSGVFYNSGSNITRGQIDQRPYEVSDSSTSQTVLLDHACSTDCPKDVHYTTDATGPMSVTSWAAVYSVDPSDPTSKVSGGKVSRR